MAFTSLVKYYTIMMYFLGNKIMNIKFWSRVVALATIVCSNASGMDLQMSYVENIYDRRGTLKQLKDAQSNYVNSVKARFPKLKEMVTSALAQDNLTDVRSTITAGYPKLDLCLRFNLSYRLYCSEEDFQAMDYDEKVFNSACQYMYMVLYNLKTILEEELTLKDVASRLTYIIDSYLPEERCPTTFFLNQVLKKL